MSVEGHRLASITPDSRGKIVHRIEWTSTCTCGDTFVSLVGRKMAEDLHGQHILAVAAQARPPARVVTGATVWQRYLANVRTHARTHVVFAKGSRLDEWPDEARNLPEHMRTTSDWVWWALSQLPEDTRFKITVEAVPEDPS